MTDYLPIVLLVIVGLMFLTAALLRRRNLRAEDVEGEYWAMLREIADADPALKGK